MSVRQVHCGGCAVRGSSAACAEQTGTGYQGWVEADLIFVSPDESGPGRVRLPVREGDTGRGRRAAVHGLDDDLQKRRSRSKRAASLANAQQTFDRAQSR